MVTSYGENIFVEGMNVCCVCKTHVVFDTRGQITAIENSVSSPSFARTLIAFLTATSTPVSNIQFTIIQFGLPGPIWLGFGGFWGDF